MVERLATFAMGTRFELVVSGEDASHFRAIGEAALAEIDDLDRRWSLFRRDSLVTFINANASERPVRLDHDTLALLAIAEQVRRDSGGLFDVTVGGAMLRWGFRGEELAAEMQRTQRELDVPSPAVTDFHGRPNQDSSLRPLRLCGESSSVLFTRPGITLDFGGIAKGYAIDAALAILREHGVTCALIHGGTSCIGAIGSPPDQEAWMISVEAGGPLVPLRDSCMAVSSPEGREVESEGRRIGHIIDPRSGEPAVCARVAAVIGPSAAVCDAWTKPALIARTRPAGLPRDYSTMIDGGPEVCVQDQHIAAVPVATL